MYIKSPIEQGGFQMWFLSSHVKKHTMKSHRLYFPELENIEGGEWGGLKTDLSSIQRNGSQLIAWSPVQKLLHVWREQCRVDVLDAIEERKAAMETEFPVENTPKRILQAWSYLIQIHIFGITAV